MGFELPQVTRCCFCFSLRTGALIIGYFSMLSVSLAMASISVFIFLVSRFVAEHKDNPPEGHSPEEIKSVAIRLYIVYAFQIFVFLFYFTISLMLVVGAHKDKPSYMRYYFMAGMVNLVLNLVVVIVGFVFTGFLSTVVQLISCAIMFYFLLVVRSAYIEIEERSKPSTYPMTLYSLQPAPIIV